jgi:hypothetical protein
MTADEKRIVEPLFKLSPLLKAAYQFFCELTGIYNNHINKEEADKKISIWIKSVKESNLVCFRKFINTLTT